MPLRYKTVLLFGAPGSGKGTQGKILESIPGFYHSATRHFGSSLRDGRIYQSFHFPVELGRR